MRSALLVFLMSVATQAPAAEFFVLPGTNTLLVLGETKLTDVEEINRYVAERQVDSLILKGPGGSLDAGYAIANIILERGLSTTVPENTDCASACSLIFSAGKIRTMENGSRLGFHLPFAVLSPSNIDSYCDTIVPPSQVTSTYANLFNNSTPDCLMFTYQRGLKDIRILSRILDRDGISETVLDLIIDTPSGDMAWVDVSQAVEFGLVSPL
jgi:hypothetical protein